MSWKVKLGIIVGIFALIAGLSTIIFYQRKMINKQNAIDNSLVEFKRLNEGIVRNQAEYVSKKDLEKFAKDAGVDLDPIKKDLEQLGADITGIAEVISKSSGMDKTNLPSDSKIPRPTKDIPKIPDVECPDGTTIKCQNPDAFGYLSSLQILNLDEPFKNGKVPWGVVKFSAWKENPWSLKVHSRKYSTVTVLSQDEDGRHFVHTKFNVNVDGKKYNVSIDDAKFMEKYPEARFRFDPKLTLGIDAGLLIGPDLQAEFVPNLQISPFNYGTTKANPEWMFLNTGLGVQTNVGNVNVILSPVNYNVGKHLPLMDNAYFGPSVGVDLRGNWLLSAGVRVGL